MIINAPFNHIREKKSYSVPKLVPLFFKKFHLKSQLKSVFSFVFWLELAATELFS